MSTLFFSPFNTTHISRKGETLDITATGAYAYAKGKSSANVN